MIAKRILPILILSWLTNLTAQTQTQSPSSSGGTGKPEGWENGGYIIHQSVEVGYRLSDVTGSQQMYDTLVNQQEGPRFLEQTLSMQSENHEGLLFDNLFIESFGWGGDPENALRARVDKSKWYDFRGSFRRDQNNFDYNLLANPINPPTSSPSIPALSSPHAFAPTRRMSDVDLTIMPQYKVSFRVGYSRNNMTGPSFSSVHEGTDALLLQNWNTTLDSYRFGWDFKLLPRTVFSFDEFLDYYKGDTTWQLNPFAPALIPSPPPDIPGTVELGLPFDTVNSNPCAVTPPATSLIDANGNLTNLGCNGYYDYSRSNRIRTSTATERASIHTNYWSRVELSGSFAYSSTDMNAPFNEFFNGLISRNSTRQTTVTGNAQATRISNVGDFTATVHLTEHFRLVDTFRYWAYRIPESFPSTETDWTIPSTPLCNPVPAPLLTPLSCTTQTVTNGAVQLSFNQNWKRNQVELVWDGTKHIGGRFGFRYGAKDFTHVLDFTTGDEDNIDIHEYTALFALWAKPVKGLRLNFDGEHTNNDNTIVRIGPRKESRYRVQANYTPKPWAVVGANINLWQSSNADALTDYRGHNRNYGFTASFMPKERINFDLAYNYNDYMQNAFICFNDSDTTLPVVANAGSCQANGYSDDGNPKLTNGIYTNKTHYGMGSVMFKPVPRVTTQLGYSVTSVGGETPQFNGLVPFGSLQYNYHQPLANLAIDVGHNLTVKAGWNYYQYGEKSFVGPTDPRYFHANNGTFSLRWAF